MDNPLVATLLKKSDSLSPGSHQLPVAPQVGVGPGPLPLHAGHFNWLDPVEVSSCVQQPCHVWKTVFCSIHLYPPALTFFLPPLPECIELNITVTYS